MQGLTTTLNNDMSDSGDFVGSSKIEIKMIGGGKAENQAVTQAVAEIPADKKIAKVRVFEKDRLIPG